MKPYFSACRSQPGRSLAFALRLARRYASTPAARRSIDLSLPHAQRTLVQQIVHRHRTPLQKPRALIPSQLLHLSIDVRLRQAKRIATPRALVPIDQHSEPLTAMRPARYALSQHIVERLRRIEISAKEVFGSSVTGDRTSADMAHAAAREDPLPLANARDASAPSVMSRDGRTAHSDEMQQKSVTRPVVAHIDGRSATAEQPSERSHLRAPALPEQDIERLAERVIGSIDRRIAAQRERMGRA